MCQKLEMFFLQFTFHLGFPIGTKACSTCIWNQEIEGMENRLVRWNRRYLCWEGESSWLRGCWLAFQSMLCLC